ncbi:hypothetical protein BCR42DRAFT_366261 [Absidia repens]|uniref:Uncharacterized protein n=1 Tax=Absidia repens TaxID=90262 RepID=A0A1X2IZJ3_9FUNG|nr:hypothetical protein BCR42DRAFT_366261 [Absidia repens]
MDPGYKLLEHIKTIPNLINEDPSVTTPKNSSFMDLPWSELSKLLNQKRRTSTTSADSVLVSDSSSDTESTDDSLWDANTGYQFLDTKTQSPN